ncbi:hypothetical protein ACIP5Y_18990 [Nocardia sp. NPDC088792]|uniref:hypothetical protein n=1 Tax=Nocardia sp. NPDC088792 TaxID=3364332 RepID=UPI00381E04AB
MAILGILDVVGITSEQYDAVVDRMGVEGHALGSIYLHLAGQTEEGMRIVEIWDDGDEFVRFLDSTLFPAMTAVGVEEKHTITVLPLHNVFTPRLNELPGLSRHAHPA